MKNELELKKEFTSYCYGLTKVNNEWIFWWKLLEKKDNILKNKMVNLLKLLNEDDSIILNMDIEKEIWELI